jgi:hypothetical protein
VLSRLSIESVLFQGTFIRELLSHTNLPAVGIRPDRDKVTRARALAARYEAGTVFHLRVAPGLADYEDELVAFPNGRHDDQVDAAVYGADLGAPLPHYFPALSGPFLYAFRRGSRPRPHALLATEPHRGRVRMG